MVSEDVVKRIVESDDNDLEAKIAAEEDALLGELDEDIARAATSWSPAFPGRKEVPREIAKQARKIMLLARARNVRPSEIKGAIDDYESFFLEVDGLRHRPPSLFCNRCNQTWIRRGAKLPGTCPRCKSPYWNKERVRKL